MDQDVAQVQSYGGPPNRLDTDGLCLLSLDGGGVRGLSTLYILKSIMDRLNNGLTEEARKKPCEIFDLIGGTSTGGYVVSWFHFAHMYYGTNYLACADDGKKA